MPQTIRVVARLSARPDCVEALKAACLAIIEPTRKEAGCHRYELLQNLADPTDLTFVEEWASADALNAHSKTPHIATLFAAAKDLLAGAPDIRRYQALG